MPLHDLPRLFRTVGHLRSSQIYWRGRYAFERRFGRTIGARQIATSSANGSILHVGTNIPTCLTVVDGPAPLAALIDQLARGTFEHLNVARELGRPPDWQLGPVEHDRLWTVTLHYHRWAHELAQLALQEDRLGQQAGELFVEYLSDWIDRCDLRAPGAAHLAWNAYATATRISWWIRSAILLGPAWWSERADFRLRFLASLQQQVEYLAGHIEWDLRGNHLLRDAVGLAWAGRYLEGPQATRWLAAATDLAGKQSREQILSDGGHFERSPMYHLQILGDLFELSKLIEYPTVRLEIETTLRRMTDFARWARHPDGGIPLLNDAALDSDSAPDEMWRRLQKNGLEFDASPPSGGRHFAETGLAIWHGAPWTVFFDVGPIGPDYQPGHGHADNLSLECSYDGLRLFVDPGTHSYDCDERRTYDRSTAAHNTVLVDRVDSSEVWHIFRVGRRARPLAVDVRADRHIFDAKAAHDGYTRLGSVIHHRRVQIVEGDRLNIVDCIEGHGWHRVEGGWLLEPGWAASPSAHGWELRQGTRTLDLVVESRADLKKSIVGRPWHPRFGVEIATNRLAWEWQGTLPLEVTTLVGPRSEGNSR